MPPFAGSEAESAQTSRSRLLGAGKSLFARLGYEQTSTAGIAREAGTSESQLVRYFESKSGLLEAIFDEGWKSLNERVQSIIGNATSAREAILGVVSAFILGFSRDPELAFLFLLEGRRVRGGAREIILSKGYLAFEDLTRHLIQRGQRDGSFSRGFSDAAIASALRGAAEGMIRDRIIAQRSGKIDPFSKRDIQRVFSALLEGLSGSPKP